MDQAPNSPWAILRELDIMERMWGLFSKMQVCTRNVMVEKGANAINKTCNASVLFFLPQCLKMTGDPSMDDFFISQGI